MKRDQYSVQVWNDNDFAWEETFKGDKVTIPAKGYKEMNFYDGHEFKGQFVIIQKLADETINPKTQKRIRVIEAAYTAAQESGVNDSDDGQEIFQCNAKGCRKIFTKESALIKHSEIHAEDLVVDGDAERAMPKKRGRPPKVTAEALVD